jgi:hypothetical protein
VNFGEHRAEVERLVDIIVVVIITAIIISVLIICSRILP